MAIGLGTALAIGAIGAAGSGVSSYMQSRAASKAGKQMQQGAQEASRYMQQGLGQLGQLYSPYINSGAGAIGTLGRLTTPGPGARFASYGPPNAMPQPPTGNMAVPRGGGAPMRGPYLMADGGDMIVDQPTMFIAGEAGPERATFQRPMGMGATMGMPVRGQMPPEPGRGMMALPSGSGAGDIKAAMMAKYGMGSQRGLAARPPRPQPPMPGQFGGTFSQMAGQFGGQLPMQRPMPMGGPAPPRPTGWAGVPQGPPPMRLQPNYPPMLPPGEPPMAY